MTCSTTGDVLHRTVYLQVAEKKRKGMERGGVMKRCRA